MFHSSTYPQIYMNAAYPANHGSIDNPPTVPTRKQDTERNKPEIPTKEQPHRHMPEKMPQ
ncbi:hypothetical protein GC177_06215 [bacterium]|nr:hypothetical protein [bacterium]